MDRLERPMHAPLKTARNEQRASLAIAAAFALLLLAIAASIAATVASAEAERRASQSLLVRQAMGRLFSRVQDAETGQRGFLLTGDESYLTPFTVAQREMPAAEATLRALVADNPDQRGRVDRAAAAIALKLAELTRTVELALSPYVHFSFLSP
jgi:CHASE3 domain sensor protein